MSCVFRWYRDLLDSDVLGIAACSFGTFAGMAAYAVTSYPSAIWAWSLFVLFIIPSVATGVPWIARTHRAPDRLPASLYYDNMWQAVLAVILTCFGAGFWALLDGDPNTSLWSAALASPPVAPSPPLSSDISANPSVPPNHAELQTTGSKILTDGTSRTPDRPKAVGPEGTGSYERKRHIRRPSTGRSYHRPETGFKGGSWMTDRPLLEPTDEQRTTIVLPPYMPWRALKALRDPHRVAVVWGREGPLVRAGLCPIGWETGRRRLLVFILSGRP